MSAAYRSVSWHGDSPDHKSAKVETGWLAAIHLATTDGTQPLELRTPDDQESGLLVVSGTLDLEANSGSWISRGTRAAPYDGRPFALFLPPKTVVRASGGSGEILVMSARRPAPAPAPAPIDSPVAKPLLPLAGSNKAFDSQTGTWQPIESFPDSPEAAEALKKVVKYHYDRADYPRTSELLERICQDYHDQEWLHRMRHRTWRHVWPRENSE